MAKEIINIYGFSIRENTIYEVKEKPDYNAPEGFIEYGTTKVLTNGISNEEPAAVWNPTMGVWDHGMFVDSPFLRTAIPEATARTKAVEILKEYILDPIEAIKGEGAFDISAKNDSFWNNYNISVKRGIAFNTAIPEDLFQLYILVLSKRLTPVNMISHPEFKTSQYIVLDKEESVRRESDKVVRTVRAYELFGSLKSTNKANLISVLDFAGLKGVSETTSDNTLSLAFKNFIEDKNQGVQNSEEFIKLAEATDKNTKTKLATYSKLKEYYKKGLVRKINKDFYIEDTFIGTSLKGAAEAIVSSKELTKLFASIVDVE